MREDLKSFSQKTELNAVCNSFSETLDLLWGGHLARPDLDGHLAHPTRLSEQVTHRVS